MNSHVGAAPHTTVNVGVNAVAGPNKDVHDGGVGEVLGRGGGGGTAGSRQAVILPGEAGLMQRKRKPRVQATLQNVVEVSFSKDSCFFPLVEAIQVIAAEGYLDTLIRRVLHEPPRNLRTFLMWYAIGKHSGDRTVAAVVRSFMQGMHAVKTM